MSHHVTQLSSRSHVTPYLLSHYHCHHLTLLHFLTPLTGDVVAIELLPESQWRAPSGTLPGAPKGHKNDAAGGAGACNCVTSYAQHSAQTLAPEANTAFIGVSQSF